jgi:hypothetical protein
MSLTTSVKFKEHFWTGSVWNPTSTLVYTMDNQNGNPPPPEEIQKDVKCEWRVRHSGTSLLKKKWWRKRRTEVLRISGKLQFGLDSDAQRAKLEALATRNSLYEVEITIENNLRVMQSTVYSDVEEEGSLVPGQAADGYFIFTDCSFLAPPGKQLFEYSMTLERVIST